MQNSLPERPTAKKHGLAQSLLRGSAIFGGELTGSGPSDDPARPPEMFRLGVSGGRRTASNTRPENTELHRIMKPQYEFDLHV